MSENEVQEEPSLAEKLKTMLGDFENAPTPEKVAGWKELHGDVLVSAFSDTEVFIFRPLNRREYANLQEQAGAGELDPLRYEEEAVKVCLLWSSVQDLTKKAGTMQSLLEMIMQNSNFVPPQLAAQLVAKL